MPVISVAFVKPVLPSVLPIRLKPCEVNEPETSGAVKLVEFLATIVRLIHVHWFRCVVLSSAAILVHSPALQGQRIWDDQYLAHDNPFIKSPLLIPESFRHYLFLDSLSAHYRPVQNISFIVDYFFWNSNEFGFHFTNVLLHAGRNCRTHDAGASGRPSGSSKRRRPGSGGKQELVRGVYKTEGWPPARTR